MNKEEIISVKNLSAGYKSKIVWSDANFQINKGELIGIIGPNGAGKTTLIKMLLGLIKPIGGSIDMFGALPKKGNDRISYVPQSQIIDEDSRIQAIEFVKMGVNATRYGFSLSSANDLGKAKAALDLVGSMNLASRPLNELSGGELQKVFLAQALVSNPEVLLLDEPLANLDLKRETQLVKLISQLVRDNKITALLIAHDINPLIPYVDKIIYIANGKLDTGKPENVITSENLSRMYDSNIEVLKSNNGRIAVLGAEAAVHHD